MALRSQGQGCTALTHTARWIWRDRWGRDHGALSIHTKDFAPYTQSSGKSKLSHKPRSAMMRFAFHHYHSLCYRGWANEWVMLCVFWLSQSLQLGYFFCLSPPSHPTFPLVSRHSAAKCLGICHASFMVHPWCTKHKFWIKNIFHCWDAPILL